MPANTSTDHIATTSSDVSSSNIALLVVVGVIVAGVLAIILNVITDWAIRKHKTHRPLSRSAVRLRSPEEAPVPPTRPRVPTYLSLFDETSLHEDVSPQTPGYASIPQSPVYATIPEPFHYPTTHSYAPTSTQHVTSNYTNTPPEVTTITGDTYTSNSDPSYYNMCPTPVQNYYNVSSGRYCNPGLHRVVERSTRPGVTGEDYDYAMPTGC